MMLMTTHDAWVPQSHFPSTLYFLVAGPSSGSVEIDVLLKLYLVSR